MKTTDEWAELLSSCGVRADTAATWAPIFADSIADDTFSAGNADLVPFLAQMLVETQMLEKLSENLNYSAERLMAVWPHRFPTMDDARPYARNPEALANKVYGGRMGNDQPGDGWSYRGRGIPMVTGKDGYAWLGGLMGQDLVSNPELLEQPHFALEGGIHWWEKRIPDAVLGDTEKVTQIVNGGQIGEADRERLTEKVGDVLNA
jgi:putative chitinase